MSDDFFLRVEIIHTELVDLNVLSTSLNALASQYDSFLRKQSDVEYKKSERKLLVKQIDRGSIIIDVLASIMPLTPYYLMYQTLIQLLNLANILKILQIFLLKKMIGSMNILRKIVKII